ncbi:protein translocase subunit SecD [Streptomyces sp. NPDC001380]|uniref:protein translocase subunit SecD n=1 Tax=Streptomyces sp. NPDC001380 TaxID=3364566 RepID=UPI00367650B9
MATPKSRPRDGHPGKALAFILVVMVGLVGLMFAQNLTTPRLGIDLAGGTSVTLTASSKDPKAVNETNMATAASIMLKRVNGMGVSEAETQVQGSKNIIVNIPKGSGKDDTRNAVAQIGTTAKLYFRPVLATGVSVPKGAAKPAPAPSGSASGTKPSAGSSAKPSASAASPAPSSTTAGRAVSRALQAGSTAAPSTAPSAKGAAAKGAAKASPAPSASAPASTDTPTSITTGGAVPADLAKQFAALDCTDQAQRSRNYQTSTTANAVACDEKESTQPGVPKGTYEKYALGPVAVNGVNVTDASAVFDTQRSMWIVQLKFDGTGAKGFTATTTQLAAKQSPQNQFAIVLDGQNVSAPQVTAPIPGNSAEITGSFTQKEADDLANVLKFGALPLDFTTQSVSTVSPQLGGEQLHAGLIAGAIGLGLVVLYSLVYYRGLGLVSIAGLVVSAVLTYSIMCLLGKAIGFALNLPAVCGAIVAIGITADSFIVYFERIRDEVREGAQLRTAVQRAWPRARRTILVSDFVSFLAAAVLYIVSVGKVQGFAFTLGLTTLLDVVVIFLFTKPLITLLARTKFFGGGHPWSGLDPKRLGARPPIRGGRRRTGRPSVAKEA